MRENLKENSINMYVCTDAPIIWISKLSVSPVTIMRTITLRQSILNARYALDLTNVNEYRYAGAGVNVKSGHTVYD